MGFATEFRQFATRGSVADLVAGVIIGPAPARAPEDVRLPGKFRDARKK
jgi:hypothetical protein